MKPAIGFVNSCVKKCAISHTNPVAEEMDKKHCISPRNTGVSCIDGLN